MHLLQAVFVILFVATVRATGIIPCQSGTLHLTLPNYILEDCTDPGAVITFNGSSTATSLITVTVFHVSLRALNLIGSFEKETTLLIFGSRFDTIGITGVWAGEQSVIVSVESSNVTASGAQSAAVTLLNSDFGPSFFVTFDRVVIRSGTFGVGGNRNGVHIGDSLFRGNSSVQFVRTQIDCYGGNLAYAINISGQTRFSGASFVECDGCRSEVVAALAYNVFVDANATFIGRNSGLRLRSSTLTAMTMSTRCSNVAIDSALPFQGGAHMLVTDSVLDAEATGGQAESYNIACVDKPPRLAGANITVVGTNFTSKSEFFGTAWIWREIAAEQLHLRVARCRFHVEAPRVSLMRFDGGVLESVEVTLEDVIVNVVSTQRAVSLVSSTTSMLSVNSSHVVDAAWKLVHVRGSVGSSTHPAAALSFRGESAGGTTHTLDGVMIALIAVNLHVESHQNASVIQLIDCPFRNLSVTVEHSDDGNGTIVASSFNVIAATIDTHVGFATWLFIQGALGTFVVSDSLLVSVSSSPRYSVNSTGAEIAPFAELTGTYSAVFILLDRCELRNSTRPPAFIIGAPPSHGNDSEALIANLSIVLNTTITTGHMVPGSVGTCALLWAQQVVVAGAALAFELHASSVSMRGVDVAMLLLLTLHSSSAGIAALDSPTNVSIGGVAAHLHSPRGSCGLVKFSFFDRLAVSMRNISVEANDCAKMAGVSLRHARNNSELVGEPQCNKVAISDSHVTSAASATIVGAGSTCTELTLRRMSWVVSGAAQSGASSFAAAHMLRWSDVQPPTLASTSIILDFVQLGGFATPLVNFSNASHVQHFADSEMLAVDLVCAFADRSLIRARDFLPVPSSRIRYFPLSLNEQWPLCPWSRTPTWTESRSVAPTATRSFTGTLSPTLSGSRTRTVTASLSRSRSASRSPSLSSTWTLSASASTSNTASSTKSPTSTGSATASRTPSTHPTLPPTATDTAELTQTASEPTISSSTTITTTASELRTPTPTLTTSLALPVAACAKFAVEFSVVVAAPSSNASNSDGRQWSGVANSTAPSERLRIPGSHVARGAVMMLRIEASSSAAHDPATARATWGALSVGRISLACVEGFICTQELDSALASQALEAITISADVAFLQLPPIPRIDREVFVRVRIAPGALACRLRSGSPDSQQLTRELSLESTQRASALGVFATTAVASSAIVSSAASPAAALDAQALAVFSLIDCASGTDRHSMEGAVLLLGPLSVADGPEGYLWGNVVVMLSVVIAQLLIAALLMFRSRHEANLQAAWVSACETVRFPSASLSASLIFQQGNAVLSLRLLADGRVSFVAVLLAVYVFAFPLGVALLYRNKATSGFFLEHGSVLEFYRYEPSVTAHWRDTRFRRALRYWVIPVGRWGPQGLRRRYATLISSLIPTWIGLASMPLLKANIIALLATIRGTTPVKCAAQYALLILLFFSFGIITLTVRPYRTRMMTLMNGAMLLVLAGILVNSAVLAINPFNGAATAAAPWLLAIQMVASVLKTVYVLFSKVMERCWWSGHANSVVWCAARDGFETRDMFQLAFGGKSVAGASSQSLLEEMEEEASERSIPVASSV